MRRINQSFALGLLALAVVGCDGGSEAPGSGGSGGSLSSGGVGGGGSGGTAGSSAGSAGTAGAGAQGGAAGAAGGGAAGTGGQPAPDLQSLVDSTRNDLSLPALAAVIVRSSGVVAEGVSGVRRLSEPAPASLADHWHIGSNAKAMTAALVALQVDAGTLSFEDTLGELFPDVAVDPGLQAVTLGAVLQHRAGLLPLTSRLDVNQIPEAIGNDRAAFASWVLTQPPAFAAETFNYSNAGYGLAGSILERVTGEPFESLLHSQLVVPLGMQSDAWRGWPAATEPEQPWGHWSIIGPITERPPTDPSVPLSLAPAGDYSFSLPDYARFVALNLQARRGEASLITQASFDVLHQPNGDYAMGWVVGRYNGDTFWAHEGSLDGFDAHTIILPEKDLALILVTNAGANTASSGLTQAWLSWSAMAWPTAARQ